MGFYFNWGEKKEEKTMAYVKNMVLFMSSSEKEKKVWLLI